MILSGHGMALPGAFEESREASRLNDLGVLGRSSALPGSARFQEGVRQGCTVGASHAGNRKQHILHLRGKRPALSLLLGKTEHPVKQGAKKACDCNPVE